jgi:hypothetical protein
MTTESGFIVEHVVCYDPGLIVAFCAFEVNLLLKNSAGRMQYKMDRASNTDVVAVVPPLIFTVEREPTAQLTSDNVGAAQHRRVQRLSTWLRRCAHWAPARS